MAKHIITTEPREIKDGFLVLPINFTHKGFIYKQIKRQNYTVIYQKYKENDKNKEHFEVVYIFRHPKREIAGVEIEAKEAMPSDEQWGTYGFSYSNLNDAMKKFDELVEKEENQKNEAP